MRLLAVAAVTAAVGSTPAQARFDEGGAAVAPATQVRVERFDWSDAAIGGGIGAAVALAAGGTALAVRRHRIAPDGLARPAAR